MFIIKKGQTDKTTLERWPNQSDVSVSYSQEKILCNIYIKNL